MIDAQAISIIFAGLSVGIAAIYYMMTLRNAQTNQALAREAQELALETRQAQLLMQIYETYRSPEFRLIGEEIINQEWTDYFDFNDKYGPVNNPVAWSRWGSVAAFFNGVGVLLKKELIDLDLVEELISNQAFVLWVRMEPILKGWRENMVGSRFGEKARSQKFEVYGGFDHLIREFRRREQEYLSLEG